MFEKYGIKFAKVIDILPLMRVKRTQRKNSREERRATR